MRQWTDTDMAMLILGKATGIFPAQTRLTDVHDLLHSDAVEARVLYLGLLALEAVGLLDRRQTFDEEEFKLSADIVATQLQRGPNAT